MRCCLAGTRGWRATPLGTVHPLPPRLLRAPDASQRQQGCGTVKAGEIQAFRGYEPVQSSQHFSYLADARVTIAVIGDRLPKRQKVLVHTDRLINVKCAHRWEVDRPQPPSHGNSPAHSLDVHTPAGETDDDR